MGSPLPLPTWRQMNRDTTAGAEEVLLGLWAAALAKRR